MNSIQQLNRAADNIRILSAAMVERAKSGHPGGAMGGADFLNVLYSEFLVYDPDDPRGRGVTVITKTPATCRPCFMPCWRRRASTPWTT